MSVFLSCLRAPAHGFLVVAWRVTFCVLLLSFAGGMPEMSEAAEQSLDPVDADTLFRQGKFAEAEQHYTRIVEQNPGNYAAALQIGRIALYSNRFSDAEKWLHAALKLKPDDPEAKSLLAQTYYRQDRFTEVTPLLRGGDEQMKARLLDETFRDVEPYEIEGSGKARLKFVQTDPIPVVKVSVNGEEAFFIIDTGGSEVYLEPHFAKQVGAVLVSGSATGGFAGGQSQQVQKGRIDSLTLDRFTVRNVPVNIVDTKFIGRDSVAEGIPISGFITTVLLYHFLPTLDYVSEELVLRRKTRENLSLLEREAEQGKQTVLPFWMAGDHLMVTWGRAAASEPTLFLVDTGGAGIGFVPAEALVKEGGIEIPDDGTATEKVGDLQIKRFSVKEVSLGPLTEYDVPAVIGPFPAQMEYGLGFRLTGIVSHEFFRRYALTIDFVEMRYFLKRSD